MKRCIRSMIVITTLFVLSFFCLRGIYNVKADSGFDSDYDSGSSWDSGSDWGSSSSYDSGSSYDSDRSYSSSSGSYHSSGSSSVGGSIVVVILFLWVAMVFISWMISDKKTSAERRRIYSNDETRDMPRRIYSSSINNYKSVTSEEANNIIPNFDINEFNFNAYKTFYDVQIAWMDFNYDKLKELLTDELYNTYIMDLDALKLKKQKNVMNGFELVDTKLTHLREENGKYIAKVILEVKFYDYIEDNQKRILRGTNKIKLDNTYMLTFERTKIETEENICPQCGAPVDGNSTGICEYCKSKLINDNYDWVMSKKEKISQK